MDLKNKKVLFIENEDWNEENLIGTYYKWIKTNDCECQILDHAHQHVEKLVELINWAEVIFFQSTFSYKHQIKPLGMLFAKIKEQKYIFGLPTEGTLKGKMEGTWTTDELAQLAHHKVFEITHLYPDEEEWYKEVDMQIYVDEVKRAEKERYDFNHGFESTGRKVRIKNIQATGPQ